MKKHLLFVLTFLLVAGSAHAFDPYYIGEEGRYNNNVGNDLNAVTNTGTAIESAEAPLPTSIVTMDGQLSETPVKAISVEAMISDNIQTYNIPISYGFPLSLTGNKELLDLKVVIPWTSREIDGVDDSGLGDISFSANYLIRFPELLLDSKLIIKAPTGEYKDADVPLGTGSTDVALYFNGTWYFDRFSIKGGVGYAYNGENDKTTTDISYGDEYMLLAGGDYNISETMRAGGLLVYKNREEDKLSTSYWPGINTLDLIPSFTYLWKTYNAEFNASLSIPVWDEWNSDKGTDYAYDPDRSVKFNIGVSKPF